MLGSASGTLIYDDTILLDQGLTKGSPWAKPGPLPVFVNKVLLELSHTSSFMFHLWLLLHCNSRVK